MNTRNDRDLDDLLGDDAGRIGTAYRKLSKMDPPRRLDRNVLAEASRAVHGRPRSSFWLLGIGTAAGVLLAAGIAWRVNYDMVKQREAIPASAPASEAIPSSIIRVEPRASSNDNGEDSDKVAPSQDQMPADDAEVAGAASAERNRPIKHKAAQARQKLDSAFAPEPAIQNISPTSGKGATVQQEERREHTAPMPPPAPAPPAAAATMQTPMADESRAEQGSRDGSDVEDSKVSEPIQKADGASQTDAAISNSVMRDDARRERSSFPAGSKLNAEIDRIRALLRAGQRETALEALRELRRKQPDVVLPADLRRLDG